MNNLQIFKNEEFGEVRTLEIEGKSYFMASDIARSLGYTNPQKAIRDHCKGVNESLYPTNGGMQTANFIPEGDIYRLIVKSQLPSAEKFETWVFDEVLPSIRKTGSYQKPLSEKEMLRIQLGMIDDVEQRVDKLENTMVIDYGQQQVLTEKVNRAVTNWLGGKESNAYAVIGKKLFKECGKDFKNYFNVNSRNNTPRLRFDDAIRYIEGWGPCNNSKLNIQNYNAQRVM